MSDDQQKITFDFNGNINEEINKITLSIKGLRDESGKTFKALVDESQNSFSYLSKHNQDLAVSVQNSIKALASLEAFMEKMNDQCTKGAISIKDYAEVKKYATIIEGGLRKEIESSINTFNKSIESENKIINKLSEKISTLKQLQTEYEKLSKTQQKGEEGQVLKKQIGELKSEIEGFKKIISESTSSNKGYLDIMKEIPGPMGRVGGSVQSLIKLFSTLISTPIGLFLGGVAGALALVNTWFKRTGDGEKQLTSYTSAFNGALNQVMDTAAKAGKAIHDAFTSPQKAIRSAGELLMNFHKNRKDGIKDTWEGIKKYFKGDILGGAKDLVGGGIKGIVGFDLKNYVEKLYDASEEGYKLGEKQNALDREKVDSAVKKFELETKINNLLINASNIDLSDKDRIESINQAITLSEELHNKEIDHAKRKYDLIKEGLSEQIKRNQLTIAQQEELNNAEIDYKGKVNNKETSRNRLVQLKKSITNKESFTPPNTETDTSMQNELDQDFLNSELSKNAKLIAIMKDGKAKRLTLLRQEYDETNAEIDRKELAVLTDKNASPDKKDTASSIADSERKNAYEILKQKEIQIEEEAKTKIESIWSEINARFSSKLDQRLRESELFYTEKINLAKAEGASESEIQNMEALKEKELNNIRKESAIEASLEKIAIEEEAELKILELKKNSFVLDSVYQLKKVNLEKKYAKQRLDELKKSTAEEGSEKQKQNEKEQKNLEKTIDGLEQKGKSLSKDLFKDAASGISEIVGAIGKLDEDLGVAMQSFQQFLGLAVQLSSGNYLGAVASLIGIFGSIFSSKKDNNQKEALEKAEKDYFTALEWKIDRLIKLMKELKGVTEEEVYDALNKERNVVLNKITEPAVVKHESGKVYEQNRQKALSNARKNNDEETVKLLESSVIKSGNDFTDHLLMRGGFTNNILKGLSEEQMIALKGIDDLWCLLTEEQQNYIDKLLEIRDKEEELKDFVEEKYTATTKESIADMIVQGFAEGKRSAEDFADSFEQMMKNAILRSIKLKMLENPFNQWYEKFATESKKGLTSDSIASLHDGFNNIIDEQVKTLKDFETVTGLSFAALESPDNASPTMKGVSAMSQESATELNGRFSTMIIYQEKINDNIGSMNLLMTQGIGTLTEIAANTKYCEKLETIDVSLKKVSSMIHTINQDGLKLMR